MSDDSFSPTVDDVIAANERYAADFDAGDLPAAPRRRVAIVTCMDARIDVYSVFGLGIGEAHVLRNAGGVVTDDVIRSLCLSQRALGTREILVVHHTRCGLQTVTADAFNAELEAEIGIKPSWALESFSDPAQDVRQSMRRIGASPFVQHTDHLRGFVYDVATGRLDPVDP